ncbi:DUF3108 domain-containing protein [candidate division KSB1 bacterium]|nr:DUF3108 domain-containing protein [candidate division KSB1 bacterium]
MATLSVGLKGVRAGSPLSTPQDIWRVGEELIYSVRWLFIHLGTINVKVAQKIENNGRSAYLVKVKAYSNPLLFFLDVDLNMETLVDEDLYSLHYTVKDKVDELFDSTEYVFDYKNEQMIIKRFSGENLVKTKDDTIPLLHPMQDSGSLIFYARGQSLSQGIIEVPTIVSEEEVSCKMVFTGKKSKVKIKGLKPEIQEVVEIKGFLPTKGVVGLSGDYRGWFTADERAIPLKAHLNIFLGKIVINLKSIK